VPKTHRKLGGWCSWPDRVVVCLWVGILNTVCPNGQGDDVSFSRWFVFWNSQKTHRKLGGWCSWCYCALACEQSECLNHRKHVHQNAQNTNRELDGWGSWHLGFWNMVCVRVLFYKYIYIYIYIYIYLYIYTCVCVCVCVCLCLFICVTDMGGLCFVLGRCCRANEDLNASNWYFLKCKHT
jgi:hypothetical protein